jgi:KEOPS complex subunit Cgi121
MNVQVIGMKGCCGYDEIIEHFVGLGGDVVLFDADVVCGKDYILSAVMHAERAFSNGTNRSKTLLTETILYAAGERQIGRAMEKMRPKAGNDKIVAVLFNIDDPMLDRIGMERCDSIMDASPEKLRDLGADIFEGISPEDAALEHVAMTDLLKQ